MRWLVESYGLWEYGPRKWRNIFRETSQETKKNVIVKSNRPQFSMVYTLIDHGNDNIKCSKLCSETSRLRLMVPLEFWTFYDDISMVYKSADRGKLWSISPIFNFIIIKSLSHPRWHNQVKLIKHLDGALKKPSHLGKADFCVNCT